MQLTGLQLAAILKAGAVIVKADGKTEQNELEVLFHEIQNFNVSSDMIPALLAKGDSMSAAEMLTTLAGLDDTAKKYVCGYLAAIMISDGDIDDNEVKSWKLLCTLCSFPTMNFQDALKFWANN